MNKKNIITIIPYIIISIILIVISYLSYIQNENNLIFTVDDGYIHLAIAKNIVNNNVWGITQYEATGSSSSVLWTLILVFFFKLFGISHITAFILNAVITLILFYLTYFITNRYISNIYLKLSAIFLMFFSTNFFVVFFTGMEHLLFNVFLLIHIVLTLELVTKKTIKKDYRINNIWFLFYLLNLILLCLVRYEGFVFAGITVFIFFIVKDFKYFFIIIFFIILTFFISSLIQYFYTGSLFSNSFLVKTKLDTLFTSDPLNNLLNFYITFKNKTKMLCFFFLLFLFSIILFFKLRGNKSKYFIKYKYAIIIIILYTFIYLTIAQYPNFRYNQVIYFIWFLFLFCLIDLFVLQHPKRIKPFISIVFLTAFVITFFNGFADVTNSLVASRNIYDQQIQMAKFLNKYSNNERILINDIGAISYFTETQIIDYIGLGSNIYLENISVKNKKNVINNFILESSPKIAIVYKNWLQEYGISDSTFFPVAKWTIRNNYICSDSIVTFYTFTKEDALSLRKNLEEYYNDMTIKKFYAEYF